MISSDVPVYMIQMSDNKISQYYKEMVLPSWENLEYKVHMFEATTPETLGDMLRFDVLKSKKSNGREFSPTEKAVWYSHLNLWLKCTKPMIIIEHDCMTTAKFFIQRSLDFKFLSKDKNLSPCNAYFLTPKIANKLIVNAVKNPLTLNTDGFMYTVCKDEPRGFCC